MRGDPSTGCLLAIDSSIASAGVALFCGGALVAADAVRCAPREGESSAERCLRMSELICDWAARQKARPRFLVVEWPQIYQRSHLRKEQQGADPNDLVGMAGVASAVAAVLSLAAISRGERLEVVSYKPGEWLGGSALAKATTKKKARLSPRARSIEKRLTSAELKIWSEVTSHDAIDAVGLALHALGRDPQRVYDDGMGAQW